MQHQSNEYILNSITQIVAANQSSAETLPKILRLLREQSHSLGMFLSLERGQSYELPAETRLPLIWWDISEQLAQERQAVLDTVIDIAAAYRPNSEEPIHLPEDFHLINLPSVNNHIACILVYMCPDVNQCRELVITASAYIGLLLKNTDLAETLAETRFLANRHLNEIAAIYEIGVATEEAAVESLLNLIVSKAAAVMDAQACSLLLSDGTGGLVIKASYGLTDEIINQTRVNYGEGIAGHVAVTGEPMLIADVEADPRLSDDIRPRSEISGSICVPLKENGGAVYGVLNIRRHFPKPAFNEEDLRLFQVFSTHADLAISNGELYARLHSKIHEMEIVADIMRNVSSSLSLDDRLQAVARAIRQVVGFDRCCVYLIDANNEFFVSRILSGYSDPSEIQEYISVGEGIFHIAASERVPVFTNSLPGMDNADGEDEDEYLVAPIVVKKICIGAVVVDNKITHTKIEHEQINLLTAFVNQVGVAVENARLYEAMQQKYEELNVLYEHSRSISAVYGLQSASEALMKTCNQAVKCSGTAVILLDTLRGNARLLTADGDLERVSSQLKKAFEDEEGIQYIRSQRKSEILGPDALERDECPVAQVLDKRWPVNRKNIVTVPLISEDTVIGIVVLTREIKEEFKEDEIKLLSIMAGHAATVIKNAFALEQRMSQKVLELSTLYDFSSRISTSVTLPEAFDSILAILDGLVDFDESVVYVLDRERGLALPGAARSRGTRKSAPREEPLDGQGIVSWVVNEGKAILSPDLPKDPRFGGLQEQGSDIRSVMAIPLVVHDEVVAALTVSSESPSQYTEDNVRVLSIIASQGAAIFSELQALNRLASYTDNILASIGAGVITVDQDFNVISWNAAAERITGIQASDIVGKDTKEVIRSLPISDEGKRMMRDKVTNVAQTGETYYGYKLRFVRVDVEGDDADEQHCIYLNISVSQLRDRAGNKLGLVFIFEDITREQEMDNRMQRLSGLAAIGQLAANIAHELRNPLSSIKGAAQLLLGEYFSDQRLQEFLNVIVEEVNGLNKLTTEFLDFAKPVQLDKVPTSLNRLVQKNIDLVDRTLQQNNIVLKLELEDGLPEVEADSGKIEQVLWNIILNAIQAMPDGGEVQITTESRSGGVALRVSDNGAGIPKDYLERVFQPFVTTKTKGTGLGLSIVSNIIENHNGRIILDSTVGEGTTITIVLPFSSDDYTHEGAALIFDEDATLERRFSRPLN